MKMRIMLNTSTSLCSRVVATPRRRFDKQHESCKRLRQVRAQVATQKLHTSVRAVEERSSPLFPAARSTDVSRWIAACSGLQVLCLVAVLGIQVALLLERLSVYRTAAAAPDQSAAPRVQHFARQSVKLSASAPVSAGASTRMDAYQPLLLALAMAAAFVARRFGPKECALAHAH